MKYICYIIFTFIFNINVSAQYDLNNIYGKYSHKADGPHGSNRCLLKLNKDGTYISTNNDDELGTYSYYGIWSIEGDSISVSIKTQEFYGKIDSVHIRFKNFKYKIENNSLCLTTVSTIKGKGSYKVFTCYKKIGKRNKNYIPKTYTKIDDPGYIGLWRNETKK